MIANPSIAFNDFSGSAKDVTARHSKGRTVLSVKSRPTGMPSTAQIVSRNTLSRISRAYQQLSDSQQLAWGILADRLRSKSVLGYSFKLTPHNAFVRLNCNRALAGKGILVDPPAMKSIPLVIFAAFYVNSEEVTVEEVQQPDDNYKLVVKMTGAQSAGVSNAWSKTVVISSAEDADWGDLDLTDAFAEVKGTAPANGMKYFVEMFWLDAETGFTGPVRQLSGLAGSESLDGDGSTGERRQVKVKFYDNSYGYYPTYMKDIDFELTPGSLLGSLKGKFVSEDSMAGWPAKLDADVKYKVPPFMTYAIGREIDLRNSSSQCRLGVLEVYSQVYGGYSSTPEQYEFFISRFNVTKVKSFEIFDTMAVKLK
jgi:hypothetical protein